MASRRAAAAAASVLRAASARPVLAAAAKPSVASATAVRAPIPRLAVPRAAGQLAVRWYSAPSENRVWSFEEVKAAAEAPRDGEAKVVLVDVREPHELFQTGKIPGAINIPITSAIQSFHLSDEDFEELYGFDRPPKDAELLFYCKAGVRARTAAGLAKDAGWTNVGEYSGSWLDWEAKRGPVEKVDLPKN